MTTPTCISYIRFSSERQSLGNSLERQLKLSRDYASKRGYVIDEKYNFQDLGVSAYTGEHAKFGDLNRFLTAIKNSEIPKGSILLVESLDRLSRESVSEAFTQLQAILKEGIKVVTLCDEMEYTKENMDADFSKLIISLSIMMRANEESKTKSIRIRDGFDKKRKNLANVKMTANAPTWLKLNKETNTFEILQERAQLIKRIFQMSYDGIGIITIARQFNKEKIPAFRSKNGWCQSTVRKILSSRSVIGEYQPNIFRKGMKKPEPIGDVVIDYYPQIISKEIYYAVQARLVNGTHIAGRTAKIENLFGGLTFCGYCGARMDVVSHKESKNDLRYLTCTNARSGVGCSYVSFKCNELETAFLSFCKDKELLDVLHLEGERDNENKKRLLHQFSATEGELESIKKKIAILDDELLETDGDMHIRTHYRDKLRLLLQSKSDCETELSKINNEITNINLTFEDVDTRVNNILDTVKMINESATEEERILFRGRLRNNLRQIVKKVVVYPRGSITSDDRIQREKMKQKTEIDTTTEFYRDTLRYEHDAVISQMLKSQNNTKDERFFEVYFKNGNFIRIIYLKNQGVFNVSFNRVGNIVEWSSSGKQMKPIVFDELDEFAILECEKD